MTKEETRFGFVTIMGAPNAGKSTLVNHMVGDKVSIVTSKVQTTRSRIIGIVCHNKAQLVLIDTPGIFKPDQKNTLEKSIVQSAWDAQSEGDFCLLLVDVTKKNFANVEEVIEQLTAQPHQPIVLVLNKIDQIDRKKLLDIAAHLNTLHPFEATFMISALKGHGVADLLDYLAAHVPAGIWHYPEDQMNEMPERLLSAEITREKLFEKLYQELPYGLTVETEKWEAFDNGDIKIEQVIIVSREAHKKIILGKKGQMIKTIGQQAREELQKILGTKIHLKLFVKVQENWMDDEERYALWGLSIKK